MLRIGILINDFESLENWELRIIENIKNDPDLELALLIKDGRCGEKNIKSKKTISEYIFNKQVTFEKNRYLKNIKNVDKKIIIKYLYTIPVIEINPKNDGFLDILSNDDIQNFKKYNLDLLLKHGFYKINEEILKVAKHGVWLLVHGNSTKIAGPPGFWEIATKQPVIEVSLIKLTNNINQGFVIDTAYFNRHNFSYIETNVKALESSVSLLFKNIKKIELGTFSVSKSIINYKFPNDSPKLGKTLNYSFNYFNSFFNGFLQKIYGRFGIRSNHWTLFIGKGNFMETDLSKLIPLKLPNDEFWADPFLFKYKDEYYIFFENYSYKTGLGKISCGKVAGNKLIEIVDVLLKEYHLSYPFIFKESGEIFMMPETGQNKRLEIYKCVSFPNEWKLYTTAFEGENIADAFFYSDKQKNKWLFINKVSAPNVDRTSELYIYKVDSLKLNKLIPHQQNPVIIDSRVARNGGAIFKYNDKIYRPSQSNKDGLYGKALNINRIKKLTINEYKEETIRKVESNFQKDMVSIHHLHQIDGMFVFDGAFQK